MGTTANEHRLLSNFPVRLHIRKPSTFIRVFVDARRIAIENAQKDLRIYQFQIKFVAATDTAAFRQIVVMLRGAVLFKA